MKDSGKDNRDELISDFLGDSALYYQQEFAKIGGSASWVWSFNWVAMLLGPIWYGVRRIWKWGLPFVMLETFALVQIMRGLFGDLAADSIARIDSIQNTLSLRKQQLQAAIEKGSDKVESIQNWIVVLEAEIADINLHIKAQQDFAIWVALGGFVLLFVVKVIQGAVANFLLERRFSEWLSDRKLISRTTVGSVLMSGGFVLFIFAVGILHYGIPSDVVNFDKFPTNPEYRTTAITWIVDFFAWMTSSSANVFYGISYAIRIFLDYLEILFVQTPWPIIVGFIVLLTGLTSGWRGALFASGALAFMGLFQFWEKAMTTLALLGTAACISISIGVPLGVFCARRERFYRFIRPIMDFMQTMPSFVFMIPVIALFSVGKPAAIIITMIFGGTPVVRLTVLGMRGVPESVREAAIAYGASKWYLLTRVDLPLAAPSIFAGINQTIMLSLAMVVVASLIGAKGLGEDVLEALQYANVGQGILAGFAILFCAMILNRIIQGSPDK